MHHSGSNPATNNLLHLPNPQQISLRLPTNTMNLPILVIFSVIVACSADHRQTCICTAQFRPVCCKLPSGEMVTKSNDCQCACAQGKVIYEGECDSCVCTAVSAPVCCELPSGERVTKGNACQCDCANDGKVLFDGECDSLVCPLVFQPVCCLTVTGTFTRIETKSNACFCEGDGGFILVRGRCDLG